MTSLACRMPKSAPTGWGRCGNEISWRMQHKGVDVKEAEMGMEMVTVANVVLSPVSDHRFQYTTSELGVKNIGYGFIENNIYAKNLAYYGDRLWDHIACGSTWMREWLKDMVKIDTSVVIQGVNPAEFYYKETLSEDFVVGSFGKFEFRKSQDLVIAAFAIFQKMHPDVNLVYNWNNPWPDLIRKFAWNKHTAIRMHYSLEDQFYSQNQRGLYAAMLEDKGIKNSLNVHGNWEDTSYRACDVILFPNRCEAGTNLCLMEALACGVPCIVTDATGHTDITRDLDYPCEDLLLNCGKPRIFTQGEQFLGEWHEPCLDEIVSKLEQAYRQRDDLRRRRKAISEFGAKFTWGETTDKLHEIMSSYL